MKQKRRNGMLTYLWGRLGLEPVRHRMVALVGAGGKTSTLYMLAQEAKEMGKTVLVTTTTHMKLHSRLTLATPAAWEEVKPLLGWHRIVMAGRLSAEGKFTGPKEITTARSVADVVLVEADGARRLPLKAPAEHEPVLPCAADAVIAVAGLDAVGQPIEVVCHRPEQVSALLETGRDHVITPADIVTILASPRGGRKQVKAGVAFRCLLNKADTPEKMGYALKIQRGLMQRGIHSAITHYSLAERDGKCLS